MYWKKSLKKICACEKLYEFMGINSFTKDIFKHIWILKCKRWQSFCYISSYWKMFFSWSTYLMKFYWRLGGGYRATIILMKSLYVPLDLHNNSLANFKHLPAFLLLHIKFYFSSNIFFFQTRMLLIYGVYIYSKNDSSPYSQIIFFHIRCIKWLRILRQTNKFYGFTTDPG